MPFKNTDSGAESVFLKDLRMTYYVETCRPDIYTIVYKINVVLMTDL